MAKPFEILDLSDARFVYAVGDIHGCFTMLEEKLTKIGFDKEQDHILSVGDLVDRGPESHLAGKYVQQPWFHHVRGNHEDLLGMAMNGQPETHARNGGLWLEALDLTERDLLNDLLNDAPVIMEVISPTGKRYGLVHACFPSDDWRHAEQIANDPKAVQICMWDRTDVRNPKTQGIAHIDHVFHGHTPLPDPKTVANVTWLDTGACFGNRLTLARLV
jgi:serine/threonine protein phosphatase 1